MAVNPVSFGATLRMDSSISRYLGPQEAGQIQALANANGSVFQQASRHLKVDIWAENNDGPLRLVFKPYHQGIPSISSHACDPSIKSVQAVLAHVIATFNTGKPHLTPAAQAKRTRCAKRKA